VETTHLSAAGSGLLNIRDLEIHLSELRAEHKYDGGNIRISVRMPDETPREAAIHSLAVPPAMDTTSGSNNVFVGSTRPILTHGQRQYLYRPGSGADNTQQAPTIRFIGANDSLTPRPNAIMLP